MFYLCNNKQVRLVNVSALPFRHLVSLKGNLILNVYLYYNSVMITCSLLHYFNTM